MGAPAHEETPEQVIESIFTVPATVSKESKEGLPTYLRRPASHGSFASSTHSSRARTRTSPSPERSLLDPARIDTSKPLSVRTNSSQKHQSKESSSSNLSTYSWQPTPPSTGPRRVSSATSLGESVSQTSPTRFRAVRWHDEPEDTSLDAEDIPDHTRFEGDDDRTPRLGGTKGDPARQFSEFSFGS